MQYIILISLFCLGLALLAPHISSYIFARKRGLNISFQAIVFMHLRKAPVKEILNAMFLLKQEGISVEFVELEAHALAGGDVMNIVKGLITAKLAKVDLNKIQAFALDLAKKDILEYITFLQIQKEEQSS